MKEAMRIMLMVFSIIICGWAMNELGPQGGLLLIPMLMLSTSPWWWKD